MEQEGERRRLDEGQRHRHVAGPLGDHLAPRLALVLEGLESGDDDRQQLHDDRGRDVGQDPQCEDRELLQGSTREEVEEAVDAARLLLGLEQFHRLEVDAGNRDGGPQAVDAEHGQREDDLPPQVRHFEHVSVDGEHLRVNPLPVDRVAGGRR